MIDPVSLARDLVAIPSVSRDANRAVADFLDATLARLGFDVERLAYVDPGGQEKVSLVARRGDGSDGLALISHSDTVPGSTWTRDPWDPVVEGDRLIGLGACDMKGPLAATIAAAASVEPARLRRPILIVVTADEEVGGGGAKQVVAESALLGHAARGVVAEPTRLVPIHAHKGVARIVVTAHGSAAHTSTDLGVSANFLIAPFLAEMAELARRFRSDPAFQDPLFDPPTNGFNMALDDGGGPTNVTAARTVCRLSFRPMPAGRPDEVVALVGERARAHGLEVESWVVDPFFVPLEAEIVRGCVWATGGAVPRAVPFGTDALFLQQRLELAILGPGDIAQAHTAGEWIDLAQLRDAVAVYRRLVDRFCV